jgi:hypothetical protein
MQTTVQKTKTSSPTLETIRMVEQTIRGAPNSLMKISELKRMLPRQVNHNTLKTILEYLEESGKIYASLKGIVWVENNSPKFKALLDKSWEYVSPGKLIPPSKRNV